MNTVAPTFASLQAHLDRGEVDQCRAVLDREHSTHGHEPLYLSFRAELLRRSGDMNGALACCLDLSRRFPLWDRHRYTMADVASHLGEVSCVMPAFETIASNFTATIGNQVRAEAWYVLGLDREVAGLPRYSDENPASARLTRVQIGQAEMRTNGIAAGLPVYREAWATAATWEDLHGAGKEHTADFWHGQCALPRRLRLRKRGGIGDYFLWARYLPLLEAHGVQVIHDTDFVTGMRPKQMTAAPALAQTEDCNAPSPFEEMWTDPFTLFANMYPRFGYTDRAGYYEAPTDAAANSIVKEARARAKGKPCWAIFWSANESHGNFALKSACLPHVTKLLEMDGIHWVVVQRGHQMRLWMADERSALTSNVNRQLSIDETAGLLSQLDGALVVDSAIAHIAAAVGVPTFLLASKAPCWRYEQSPRATPWYESMTVFRQPTLGDWEGAVNNAASALAT